MSGVLCRPTCTASAGSNTHDVRFPYAVCPLQVPVKAVLSTYLKGIWNLHLWLQVRIEVAVHGMPAHHSAPTHMRPPQSVPAAGPSCPCIAAARGPAPQEVFQSELDGHRGRPTKKLPAPERCGSA